MNALERIFGDRIFCINVAAREDRWQHVQALCTKFGIHLHRFEAKTGIVVDGQVNNNAGCTASHRALLDAIVEGCLPNALIFEDDFDLLHEDFMDKFRVISEELPDNWDMFYLGGHYGEQPIARNSKHLIRCGRFLTTSSYGITFAMAVKMREHINGIGPIDSLYGGFHRDNLCLVADPRLCVQYPNVSDLQGRFMDNSMSMLDKASALPPGE